MSAIGDGIQGIVSAIGSFVVGTLQIMPPWFKLILFAFVVINLFIPFSSFILGNFYSCDTDGNVYLISARTLDMYVDDSELYQNTNQTPLEYTINTCLEMGYKIDGYENNTLISDYSFMYVFGWVNIQLDQGFFSNGVINGFNFANKGVACNGLKAFKTFGGDKTLLLKNYGKKVEVSDTATVALQCTQTDPKLPTLGMFGIDVLDAFMWNILLVFGLMIPPALKWYSQFK
jgi:hypothetical protein